MTSKVGLILEAAEYLQTEGCSGQEPTSPEEDGLQEYDEDCSESEGTSPDDFNNKEEACPEHNGGNRDESLEVKSKLRSRFNSSSDEVLSPKRAKLMDKHNKNERRRRKNLKHSVNSLRDQLTIKTRRPVVISVLKAAYDEIQSLKEIEKQQDEVLDKLKQRNIILSYFVEKSLKDIKNAQITPLASPPSKQSHSTHHQAPGLVSPSLPPTLLAPLSPTHVQNGAFSFYKYPYFATTLPPSSPSANGLIPHSIPHSVSSSSTNATPYPVPYFHSKNPLSISPTNMLSPPFSFPFYPSSPSLSTTPFLYPYHTPLSSPSRMLPHSFMVPTLSQYNSTTYLKSRKNGHSHPESVVLVQKSKNEIDDIDVVNCNTDDYSECSRHTPIPPPLIPITHIDTPNHLPVIMSSPTKSSTFPSDRTCSLRHRKLSHP